MFSYLEIKEDNPLHFQCLTANVLHHNSLKLLTLWRVVLGFSVSVIFFFLVSYRKTSLFPFWRLLRFAASPLFRSRFSVFGKNKIGFLDLLFDAVWCFSGFSSEIMLRFWSKFITVLRFIILNCYWYGCGGLLNTPMPLSLRAVSFKTLVILLLM